MWIPGTDNSADAFTKAVAKEETSLMHIMRTGQLSLNLVVWAKVKGTRNPERERKSISGAQHA